jgi:hypothetical protein
MLARAYVAPGESQDPIYQESSVSLPLPLRTLRYLNDVDTGYPKRTAKPIFMYFGMLRSFISRSRTPLELNILMT